MSSFITSWILELTDRISAPAKEIWKVASATSKEWQKIGEAASDSMSDIKEQLGIEKRDLKDYQKAVKETEKKLAQLEKEKAKAGAGSSAWKKSVDDIKKLERQLDKYRNSVKETEHEIQRLETRHDELAASSEKWSNIATGINQTTEIIQKITNSLSFGPEIAKLESNIQRMTSTSGDALDDLTQKVFKLSEVYGEDSESIAQAANATAKSMGISFTEALDLIEQGYLKGANLNGDMLDQMKEYGAQMKAAGLSGEQMIALMAKAGKDGIFSDKALDSIKEANLSLREMGQPQIDALKAIGLEAKDLAGKTSFEAVQMITKSMDGATTQARQMVLTDIFKGAGEDAGFGWISGLNSVDMDINNIPSVQQSGASMKGWLADVKGWFGTTFSGIAANSQMLGGLAQMVAGVIPVMNALKSSTILATAAQWAMNIAGYANPYVLMAVAIIALIAATVAIIVYFDEITASLTDMWENGSTLTRILMVLAGVLIMTVAPILGVVYALRYVYEHFEELSDLIKEVVVHQMKSFLNGIMGIGSALVKFFEGDFSGAIDTGKNAILDITGANTAAMAYDGAMKIGSATGDGYSAGLATKSIEERTKMFMEASSPKIVGFMKQLGKYHGDAYVDAKIQAAEKWAAYMDKLNNTDKYSKKVQEAKQSWNADKANTLDGKVIDNSKTKNKGKSDGLSISGGSGGGKAITMNLTFNQQIHAKDSGDVYKIANDVVAIINDRLKDALLST